MHEVVVRSNSTSHYYEVINQNDVVVQDGTLVIHKQNGDVAIFGLYQLTHAIISKIKEK